MQCKEVQKIAQRVLSSNRGERRRAVTSKYGWRRAVPFSCLRNRSWRRGPSRTLFLMSTGWGNDRTSCCWNRGVEPVSFFNRFRTSLHDLSYSYSASSLRSSPEAGNLLCCDNHIVEWVNRPRRNTWHSSRPSCTEQRAIPPFLPSLTTTPLADIT